MDGSKECRPAVMPTNVMPAPVRRWVPTRIKYRYQLHYARGLIQRDGGRWNGVEAVFVHVPKTGGTSVSTWLRETGSFLTLSSPIAIAAALNARPRFVSTNHMDPGVLVQLGLTSVEELEAAYSFAVVRDPYARTVSAWRHLIQAGQIPSTMSLAALVEMLSRNQLLARRRTALRRVLQASESSRFPLFLLPQTTWLRPLLWRGPAEVFRVEALRRAEESLGHRFHLESPLPHLNVSRGPRASVDSVTASRIRRIYAEDFEFLGYPREVPDDLRD